MPRLKGGPLTEKASKIVSIRIPKDLLAAAEARCGGKQQLTEWLRNLIRQGCGIPVDYAAGYDEGFRAGWSDSKKKWTDAMQGTGQ